MVAWRAGDLPIACRAERETMRGDALGVGQDPPRRIKKRHFALSQSSVNIPVRLSINSANKEQLCKFIAGWALRRCFSRAR